MEAIWIALAFGLGLAARQIGLPSLVGYLAAGFCLNGLGLGGEAQLNHIAHMGVVLLLFTVGLKLRIRSVLRPEVLGGGSAHLVVTCLLLVPALHALGGLDWNVALLLAVALSFSSTVIAAKILEEKRELRAFHGRVAIGILIIQDLVAVAVLSLAGGHAPSVYGLALLGLPLLRPVFFWLLDRSGHDELLVLLGLLLAVVAGGLGFEYFGLSAELGALVLGALLADHPRAKELSASLWALKEIFLVGFFLQIGMSGLPTLEDVGVSLVLTLVLPVKAVLFFFILLCFRLRARSAFLTALSLSTFSEFGLIVANLAATQGLIGPEWLVILALTVALSFVLAAPINRLAHSLYERFESRIDRFELDKRHPDEQPISLGKAQILIMGMGRVGSGAYNFFTERGIRVVGLDSDPGKIEKQRHAGRRVLYADSEDPGFWQHLNLDGIRAVLITIPDMESRTIAASQLRRRGFEGLISATNLYDEEADTILAAGVDTTFNYANEAGVGFAEHAWETLFPEEGKAADD
jgi:predicted Kef-type K+ transport protein